MCFLLILLLLVSCSAGGIDPLFDAVKKGDIEQVKLQLEKKANVNVRDEEDATLLHYAVSEDNVEIAKLLISHGGLVEARTKKGRTPLFWCMGMLTGGPEVARILISHGADVRAQDEEGKTPLHRAAWTGRVELADVLVENGVDPDIKDIKGKTPLHEAVAFGRKEMAAYLIAKGADVNITSQEGKTPLYEAWESRAEELAALLIANGADVRIRHKIYDTTLLHWASEDGHLGLAKLLVDHGADVNAEDRSGETPLQCALRNNKVEVADFLKKSGAR